MLQRSGIQKVARDVIQPYALPQIVEQFGRFHFFTSHKFFANAANLTNKPRLPKRNWHAIVDHPLGRSVHYVFSRRNSMSVGEKSGNSSRVENVALRYNFAPKSLS